MIEISYNKYYFMLSTGKCTAEVSDVDRDLSRTWLRFLITSIILRCQQVNVQQRFQKLTEILAEHYTEEDRQIVACPRPEQVPECNLALLFRFNNQVSVRNFIHVQCQILSNLVFSLLDDCSNLHICIFNLTKISLIIKCVSEISELLLRM
jgi:hypothetical protein